MSSIRSVTSIYTSKLRLNTGSPSVTFETHLHADFVSGHRELSARTGAQIYIGAQAAARFPHVAVHDGFELKFGSACIRVLETPGHTLESICLLVMKEEKSPLPWCVLTGDTLFIGDVGRPDLSPSNTPTELAGMLYDSLRQKLLTLPDHVFVYPAHGAGSLCGRNMRAERSSTIGTERLTNYALQFPSKQEFVSALTSNFPARPEYFTQDAELNRSGAPALSELEPLQPISPSQLKSLLDQGEIAVDVRSGDEFATGHVPGSVDIALSGQFASWAATLLGLASRPVLIASSDEQLQEARIRLARVGIETLQGYLQGSLPAWKDAGFDLTTISQIGVGELKSQLLSDRLQVLDVRRAAEWDAGHIANAIWWPLDNFRVSPPEIDRSEFVAVHCKSGYRSMIACSFLQRAGFRNVVNVIEGFDAWQRENFPAVCAVSG